MGKLPDYFFEIPASSTGKYHPVYASSEHGLVKHTKVAVRIAYELLSNPGLNNFTSREKDLIILSLVLHDGLKSGTIKEKYTRVDHPLLVCEFIKENSKLQQRIDKAQEKLNNLKDDLSWVNSTDEELMGVLKDFESYFIEQMIKQMKETFTDDDKESSVASQYTDTFMDYAIEDIADVLLDEVGGSMTQQLFEQMKRNYNIPTVEEV